MLYEHQPAFSTTLTPEAAEICYYDFHDVYYTLMYSGGVSRAGTIISVLLFSKKKKKKSVNNISPSCDTVLALESNESTVLSRLHLSQHFPRAMSGQSVGPLSWHLPDSAPVWSKWQSCRPAEMQVRAAVTRLSNWWQLGQGREKSAGMVGNAAACKSLSAMLDDRTAH